LKLGIDIGKVTPHGITWKFLSDARDFAPHEELSLLTVIFFADSPTSG
jgi:hypothetical protein